MIAQQMNTIIAAGIVAMLVAYMIYEARRRVKRGRKTNPIASNTTKSANPEGIVPIAYLLEERERVDVSDGCLAIGLIIALIGFTVYSGFRYFAAQTASDQIVALLLWIGNSLFWGIFVCLFVLNRGRNYIVYRSNALGTPKNRREPDFFADR